MSTMEPLTNEEISTRLKQRRITSVAEATGLTRQGLYLLKDGKRKARLATRIVLTWYFRENP